MKIERVCFSEIVEHCREEYPHEACGILAGKDNLITKVYKMTNISKTPAIFYETNPQEHLKVVKEMRNSGLEMLARYHSHVASPAYPSPRDLEVASYLGLASYPEASYLIVSLTDFHKPEVGSFKIIEGKIEEEEISYIEGGR